MRSKPAGEQLQGLQPLTLLSYPYPSGRRSTGDITLPTRLGTTSGSPGKNPGERREGVGERASEQNKQAGGRGEEETAGEGGSKLAAHPPTHSSVVPSFPGPSLAPTHSVSPSLTILILECIGCIFSALALAKWSFISTYQMEALLFIASK